MDKLIIKGRVPLNGEVSVSGAKNAVLPMLCASVMASNSNVTLKNIPHLHDVTTTVRLLRQMGVSVTLDDNMDIQLDPSTIDNFYAPYNLVKTMRSSILVLGPLLSKFGSSKVSLPGGCAIGTRPVEMHLDALSQMGASISINNGYISASSEKLIGTEIRFPKITVTGTENILMASTLAEGKTIISNAAREPEVVDLANFLNKMGASITGQGTDIIEVNGVEELKGVSYTALPDRIETGTFLVAAAITGGCVTVKNTISAHVSTIIEKLRDSGAHVTTTETSVTLDMKGQRPISVDIETGAYFDNATFILWPNPASDVIELAMPTNSPFSIYNSIGQCVWEYTVSGNTSYGRIVVAIPTQDWPDGTYFVLSEPNALKFVIQQ